MKPKKLIKASPKPPRRTKPGLQTPSVPEGIREQIAKRAYEIYERRIRQGPLDDWLLAEREILRQKKIWNPDVPHRGGYAAQEQE